MCGWVGGCACACVFIVAHAPPRDCECMHVCVCCASFNPRDVPGHAAIVDPGVPPVTSQNENQPLADRSWMEALHH